MLTDIEPGGGGLRVVPGSHKRDVAWRPEGAALRSSEGTYHPVSRFEELTAEQRSMFVELTGSAGTAVIFTHGAAIQDLSKRIQSAGAVARLRR